MLSLRNPLAYVEGRDHSVNRQPLVKCSDRGPEWISHSPCSPDAGETIPSTPGSILHERKLPLCQLLVWELRKQPSGQG